MKIIKKAFTLVELLVVIAILAILATVGIVGYTSFINKANISKDSSLIEQINLALLGDEQLNGKPGTMHEARQRLIDGEFGVDIAAKNLISTKDYTLGYDVKANQVILLDGTKALVVPSDYTLPSQHLEQIFIPVFEKDQIGANGFSAYLGDSYKFVGEELAVSTGLDVGNIKNITKISYTNTSTVAKNVVIRTNSASTVLTIDAEKDTVAHYGEAGFLNIIKVNTASYHEHGYIPQAQIAQGRIVNEAGSVETEDGSTKKAGVENLFIVAATEGSGSTAGTFNEVIVEAAQGAEVPYLDRSDVNIVDAVLVVEVKTATTDDFVYLTKSGIVEQVVVTTEKNVESATAKAGNDSSLNATASKAADEIANIAKRGANNKPLDSAGNEIEDISTINSVADITIAEPKATKADLEKSQGENALFAGGAGTEGNPYLIATVEHFANIDSLSDLMSTKPIHFKQTANITITDDQLNSGNDVYLGSYGYKNLIHTFQGKYDGNSYSLEIKIDSTSSGWIFDGLKGNVGICNLNIKHENIEPLALLGSSSSAKNVKLLNINIYGKENYIYSGPLLYCNTLSCDAEYINCTSYVNYKFGAYQGGIFVAAYFGGDSIKVLFDNCINYGSIRGGSAAFFNGNGNGRKLILVDDLSTVVKEASNKYICVKNCANKGSIIGTTNCEPFCRYAEGDAKTSIATANNEVLANFSKGNMSTSNISDYSLSANGNELVLNKSSNSSAVKYVLSTKFSGSVKFPSGKSAGSVVATVEQEFDNNNFKFITSAYLSDEFNNAFGIQYNNINSNEFSDGLGFKYKIAQVDGKNIAVFDIVAFNKVNSSYGSGSLSKTPFFELYVYGTNDELLSVTTYSLSDLIK